MPKTTETSPATVTQPTLDDAVKLEAIRTLVAEHQEAILMGMRLREERDNRNKQAVSLMSRSDAMERLHKIVKYLDDTVYSHCDDKRQAQAHALCAYVLLPALERGMTCAQGTPDYAQALAHVLSGIAALTQRGPSSVRGETELTFALQGYVSLLRGMRGVDIDVSYTTPSDKLAAIAAQEQKRAARMADAVNNLRAMLPAASVVDEK